MQGCLAELVKRNAALDARYESRVAAQSWGHPPVGAGRGGGAAGARRGPGGAANVRT